MAHIDVDRIVGSIREGVAGAGERAEVVVEDVADSIEDALEKAEFEGRRISRKVRAELAHRWKKVDKAGRDNAFVMALGALGVGVLIGWLIARDND